MGSLAGHVLPGVIFLIYGINWLVLSIITHLKHSTRQQKSSKLKRESASFFKYKHDHGLSRKSYIPLPFSPRIPVEPIIKIILPSVGIVAEFFFDVVDGRLVATTYSAFRKDGTFGGQGKLHHITMYSAFLLSGVLDLVSLCVKLPKHTTQLFLSIAFWVEGILFYFHTGGRADFNVEIHFTLTVVIFFCAVVSMLRMVQTTNLFINISLAFGILLQGTWFIQAGVALFPPSGKAWVQGTHTEHDSNGHMENSDDESGHNAIMFMSACFTWHIMGIALFALVSWVLLRCLLRSKTVFKEQTLKLRSSSDWMENEEQEKLINVESDNPATPAATIELHEVKETATL